MKTLCGHCGCSKFVQKEIRKSGVVILDGVVEVIEQDFFPVVTVFICANCHLTLPKEKEPQLEARAARHSLN